jgi:cytochrome c oxidase cbb3-type subunit 3
MIGWQAVLGDEGVGQVVQHVRSLSGAAEPSAEGAARFGQFCAACHGPGGEGMAAVGGPNLTDEIWLYGGSPEAVRQTVIQGRHGIMPAFDERLDDVQVHMLVAWLRRGGS